jgi:hypothetical protein
MNVRKTRTVANLGARITETFAPRKRKRQRRNGSLRTTSSTKHSDRLFPPVMHRLSFRTLAAPSRTRSAETSSTNGNGS